MHLCTNLVLAYVPNFRFLLSTVTLHFLDLWHIGSTTHTCVYHIEVKCWPHYMKSDVHVDIGHTTFL